MKFRSRNRKITYTVRQAHKITENGEVRVTRGLRAEFNGMPGQGSTFDSETAARKLNWSDEERKKVENYLIAHADYGRRLFRLEDDSAIVDELLHPKNTCKAVYLQGEETMPGNRP